VSHDLGVVAELSDEVLVLRHGDVVEHGPASDVISRPRTDYVRRLLASIPGAAPAAAAAPSTP